MAHDAHHDDPRGRLPIQVGLQYKRDLKRIAKEQGMTQRRVLEILIESAPFLLEKRAAHGRAENTSQDRPDDVRGPASSPDDESRRPGHGGEGHQGHGPDEIATKAMDLAAAGFESASRWIRTRLDDRR